MSGTGDKAGTRGGETTRKTRNKTKHENTLPTTREFQPRLGPHSVCTTGLMIPKFLVPGTKIVSHLY